MIYIKEKEHEKLINKAKKSNCHFKVSAIGYDANGNIIGSAVNSFHPSLRLSSKGVGLHAEINLIRRYGNLIKTIVICRVGNSGNLLPIDPCEKCLDCATKLGIKIYSISRVKVRK